MKGGVWKPHGRGKRPCKRSSWERPRGARAECVPIWGSRIEKRRSERLMDSLLRVDEG